MSALRRWGSLIPPGRCRLLLAAVVVLSFLSAVAALVPAFVIFVLAEIIYDRLNVGLLVEQVIFIAIAAVIARLGLLLVARNTAGTATELLSQSLRARAAVTIGALPLGDIAETRGGVVRDDPARRRRVGRTIRVGAVRRSRRRLDDARRGGRHPLRLRLAVGDRVAGPGDRRGGFPALGCDARRS